MSWVGGKKALREEVVKRFPLFYERYVEVFGGGGWVLFHKAPGNDFEVYNDYNGLLANLYRCVRDKPDLLINALKYVLNSREDFDRARLALRRKRTTDIQRAAWFYQVIRQSYAAALTSFASQPHDMWSNFPLIEQAHRRLADVVVENQDFQTLIRHYDRPVTFFYCDPPYHATEGYYQNIGEDGFTERDHIRLRDALLSMEGKFLLSYNDDAFIRGLYDAPGIQIEPVTRLNNIRQRYDPNCQFSELLIANYDMAERAHATTQRRSALMPQHKSICLTFRRENLMKPMYFKLYHNPENKTLTIPRAALQLSGLADAEELILHTGGGYVLAARNALSTLECLHLLQFLTSTAASLLLQLAVFSQEGAEFPECEDTLEEEDEMDDPGLTIPTCLLELAGLDEADSLEAVAEDGRVIVSKAEDDDPSEHREEDPLQEFDEGFRAMLQEGNVDLDALRRQMRQEKNHA